MHVVVLKMTWSAVDGTNRNSVNRCLSHFDHREMISHPQEDEIFVFIIQECEDAYQ